MSISININVHYWKTCLVLLPNFVVISFTLYFYIIFQCRKMSWLSRVLEKKNTDCIITLGCIIKGETAHFEYISNACANTLSQLTIQSEIPIMFGVITAYNREQAIARSQVDFDNKDNLNIGFNVANAAAQTLISKKIHKL